MVKATKSTQVMDQSNNHRHVTDVKSTLKRTSQLQRMMLTGHPTRDNKLSDHYILTRVNSATRDEPQLSQKNR